MPYCRQFTGTTRNLRSRKVLELCLLVGFPDTKKWYCWMIWLIVPVPGKRSYYLFFASLVFVYLFSWSSPPHVLCYLFIFQEVTGIYTNNFDLSLNTKNGFPVFATVIEANHVTKKQDLFSAYKLTQEDKEEIEKLAKDPRIGERVYFLHYFSTNHVPIVLT